MRNARLTERPARETPGVRPWLRDGLDVIRTGPRDYLLRDRSNGRVFTFSADERFLLIHMDGSRTPEELQSDYDKAFKRPLSVRHIEEFIQQLSDNGLLRGSWDRIGAGAPRFIRAGVPERAAGRNRIYDFLLLMASWWVHPLAGYLVILASPAIPLILFFRLDAFIDDLTQIAMQLYIPLLFVLLGMKLALIDIPTGVLQGMVWRKHRGRVGGFRLRWMRGLIPTLETELFVGLGGVAPRARHALLWTRILWMAALSTIASWGWAVSDPSGHPHAFFLLLMIPSIGGLILHLCPLMPLDGYALLCNYLGVRDLYHRARMEAVAWLTVRRAPEAFAEYKRFWLRAYGLASYSWSLALAAGIIGFHLWYLSSMFKLAGAVLCVAIVVRWYWEDWRRWAVMREPFNRIIRFGGRWYVRWPIRFAVLAGIVLVGLVPYSYHVSGDCTVVPAVRFGIRSQLTDEIVAVHASEGQQVAAGDPIVTLSGRDTSMNVATTRAELAEATATYNMYVKGSLPEDIASVRNEVEAARIELEFQETELKRQEQSLREDIGTQEEYDQKLRLRDSARAKLEGAEERLSRVTKGYREEEIAAARAEVERLEALLRFYEGQHALTEIRSPIGGRVITPHMDAKLGQIAQEGELICVVQGDELLVEIQADEAAATQVEVGMPVTVRLWGTNGDPLAASVARLATAVASDTDVDDPALRSDRELLYGKSTLVEAPDTYLYVYAQLREGQPTLAPGAAGYAKIIIRREALWQSLYRPIARFFRIEVWSWLP